MQKRLFQQTVLNIDQFYDLIAFLKEKISTVVLFSNYPLTITNTFIVHDFKSSVIQILFINKSYVLSNRHMRKSQIRAFMNKTQKLLQFKRENRRHNRIYQSVDRKYERSFYSKLIKMTQLEFFFKILSQIYQMWHKRSVSFTTLPNSKSINHNPAPKPEVKKAFSHLKWKQIMGRPKDIAVPVLKLSTPKKEISCLSTSRTVMQKVGGIVISRHNPENTYRKQSKTQWSANSIQQLKQLNCLTSSHSSQNSIITNSRENKVMEDILSFSRSIVKRPSIEVCTSKPADPEDSRYVFVQSPVVKDKPQTFESMVQFAGTNQSFIQNKQSLQSKVTTASSSKDFNSEIKATSQSSYVKKADSMYITEGYKGEYLSSLRHGHGVYVFDDGSRYEGNWYLHKMSGQGRLYYSDGKLAYDGEWAHDFIHGKGKLYRNGLRAVQKIDFTNLSSIERNWVQYEGYFKFDQRSGEGMLLFSDGSSFKGQFENNLPSGRGVFTNKMRIVEGIWFQGLLQRIVNQRKL